MAEIYPFFEFKSIENRCDRDLIKFKNDQHLGEEFANEVSFKHKSTTELNKELMQAQITKILELMKTIRGNPQPPENYIEMVKNEVDDSKKQKLWIARTYLFYQILIFATAMFLDKVLHDEIYKNNANETELVQLEFIDIKDDLTNYKMGIFGSMSPSSDIDIGIQYSGQLKNTALAFIVSTIENLFLIFTGKESLDFDIETYADMLTIPNTDQSDANHPDIFYLDTSKLTEDDLATFLPIAGNSIVRNFYLAKNGTPTDADLANLTFERILTELKYVNETPDSSDLVISFFKNESNKFKTTPDWLNQSKIEVAAFMKKSSHDRREMYYNAVLAAETVKNAYLTLDETNKPKKMIELLKLIGTALTYRMESYTCAPTVYHVVRTMQAKAVAASVAVPGEAAPQKYPTNTPLECPVNGTEAACVIGKVGFQLSLLEQIGYIYRFHLDYCVEGNHKNPEKCDKKKTKYTTRLVNAIEKIHGFKGGKRKRRTKKRNNKTKKRKSRRYKHRK
jgi:hypothetical protein